MYWGNVMEDVVAKEFKKRTGLYVEKANAIFQHQEHDFMIANVDRLIYCDEGTGVLECKNVSEYKKGEWEGDEAPIMYILQLQHYLAVLGLEFGYLVALVGGNKFFMKRYERDDELISDMIEAEKEFWERYVKGGEEPPIGGSESAADLLNTLYPTAIDNEIIYLDDYAESVERRKVLLEKKKALETEIKEIENNIKLNMKERELAFAGQYKISWKNYSTNRFDSKAFKEKHPDLYKEFLKSSEYRRFTISSRKAKGE